MILSRERTLDLSGSPLPKGQTSQSEADVREPTLRVSHRCGNARYGWFLICLVEQSSDQEKLWPRLARAGECHPFLLSFLTLKSAN